MIVVDASVLVAALADDADDGDRARDRLAGELLAAPALIDLEVTSVVRRLHRRGDLLLERAELALETLTDLPMHRTLPTPLLDRVWSLRATITPYDASYVALAEALSVPLLTGDERLARASGIRCAVELIDRRESPDRGSRRP